ncbi:MAG TPA: patatin-like phospholipase family protein [Paraburkholderia sp.]|nr:patatin-like phospholipase family protein [Paraburkholderia sp.]
MSSRNQHTPMTLSEKVAEQYETVALVLQGGGALGSYQAGVYEGIAEAGLHPNWVAGISIGALNTAIIAGNAPEKRVDALKAFWKTICQPTSTFHFWPPEFESSLFSISDTYRKAISTWYATRALMEGQSGFFSPRVPQPLGPWSVKVGEASHYNTAALRNTLERFADFDRINEGGMRVCVGAVNVATGNLTFFDNKNIKMRPEHFMASGALPPGFPAVEVDGQFFWDGGLVSNTPLSHVLGQVPRRDTLAFQVDLWSARGELPSNMAQVDERAKDIQYSSRTRAVTHNVRHDQLLRRTLREVLRHVSPEAIESDPWCKMAARMSTDKRYNVVQLIYKDKPYEDHFKDFQFGYNTMLDHWTSGLDDIRETFSHPQWFDLPENEAGFASRDIHAPTSSDHLGPKTGSEHEAGV